MVDAREYLPYNIWYIMFMHHQGYLNKPNKFFQDNQSATRMEINGINSCTCIYWHIYIGYLFIKDQVEKGELRVVYCPTHLMLAY